ncbi:hypothetical protein ABT084_00935 [Streptomyces sp. NPDC002138]|uniref:hypothetical protein n=1 Tax=Streptomyces sp. NPDC002138 TaxID=3154410 RepID=UPI00331728CF
MVLLAAELFVLDFEDVHDSCQRLCVGLEPLVVFRHFGESLLGPLQFLSELLLTVRNVPLGTHSRVELVLEVGVPVRENVPFDVRLDGEPGPIRQSASRTWRSVHL